MGKSPHKRTTPPSIDTVHHAILRLLDTKVGQGWSRYVRLVVDHAKQQVQLLFFGLANDRYHALHRALCDYSRRRTVKYDSRTKTVSVA